MPSPANPRYHAGRRRRSAARSGCGLHIGVEHVRVDEAPGVLPWERPSRVRLVPDRRDGARLEVRVAPALNWRHASKLMQTFHLNSNVSASSLTGPPTASADEQARAQNLGDISFQTIWETDATGVNLYQSPAWYRYVGEGPGSSFDQGWLDFYHPDDREALLKAWTRSLHSPGEHPYDVKARVRRHDVGAARIAAEESNSLTAQSRDVRDQARVDGHGLRRGDGQAEFRVDGGRESLHLPLGRHQVGGEWLVRGNEHPSALRSGTGASRSCRAGGSGAVVSMRELACRHLSRKDDRSTHA